MKWISVEEELLKQRVLDITCISDLHGHYPTLEGGDLLIVAGDLTAGDGFMQWQSFSTWLSRQQYKKKVFIAGNHDNYLQENNFIMPLVGPQDLTGVEYLCDCGTSFEGLKIWGSPWTKRFEGMNPRCMAFTVETEEELAEKWRLIPEDTDILVTHSPPAGIMDEVKDYMFARIINVGSTSLFDRNWKKKQILHIFGHVHECYGLHKCPVGCAFPNTTFINASHVNEFYEPVNKPIRIEL